MLDHHCPHAQKYQYASLDLNQVAGFHFLAFKGLNFSKAIIRRVVVKSLVNLFPSSHFKM